MPSWDAVVLGGAEEGGERTLSLDGESKPLLLMVVRGWLFVWVFAYMVPKGGVDVCQSSPELFWTATNKREGKK